MDITLKKAALLVNATLETAKALPLNTALSLSIFTTVGVADEVAAKHDALISAAHTATTLTDLAYRMRGMIGDANARVGISQRLTAIKGFEALNRIYEQLIGQEDSFHALMARRAGVKESIDTTLTRMAAMRDAFKTQVDRGGLVHIVSVQLLQEQDEAQFTLMVQTNKRAIADLKDEVAHLNYTTTIALSATDEAILRQNRLV